MIYQTLDSQPPSPHKPTSIPQIPPGLPPVWESTPMAYQKLPLSPPRTPNLFPTLSPLTIPAPPHSILANTSMLPPAHAKIAPPILNLMQNAPMVSLMFLVLSGNPLILLNLEHTKAQLMITSPSTKPPKPTTPITLSAIFTSGTPPPLAQVAKSPTKPPATASVPKIGVYPPLLTTVAIFPIYSTHTPFNLGLMTLFAPHSISLKPVSSTIPANYSNPALVSISILPAQQLTTMSATKAIQEEPLAPFIVPTPSQSVALPAKPPTQTPAQYKSPFPDLAQLHHFSPQSHT